VTWAQDRDRRSLQCYPEQAEVSSFGWFEERVRASDKQVLGPTISTSDRLKSTPVSVYGRSRWKRSPARGAREKRSVETRSIDRHSADLVTSAGGQGQTMRKTTICRVGAVACAFAFQAVTVLGQQPEARPQPTTQLSVDELKQQMLQVSAGRRLKPAT